MKATIKVETPKELFNVIHDGDKLYAWLHTSSEFINNCYKAMRHEHSIFKILTLESDIWSKFAGVCAIFVKYEAESEDGPYGFKTHYDF